MIIEGKDTKGASRALLFDVQGNVLVAQGSGPYEKAVSEERVYMGMTAVGGVDHGATVDTAAPIALANPLGSGVLVKLLRATVGYVSGTLGAGFLAYCINDVLTNALPTGTGITVVPAKAGAKRGGLSVSKALLFTTATLAATPTIVGVMGNLAPILATSAVAPWMIKDDIDGLIQLVPGANFSIQGVMGAAGTAPLVVFGLVWEEEAL